MTPYEDAQIEGAKALVMRELADELNRRMDLVDLRLSVAKVQQTAQAARISASRYSRR